jgi:transposase-like protein
MKNCPHCQSTQQRVTSGSGPHFGRLSCGECGRWLKWLSKGEVEAHGGFDCEQLNLLGGAQ